MIEKLIYFIVCFCHLRENKARIMRNKVHILVMRQPSWFQLKLTKPTIHRPSSGEFGAGEIDTGEMRQLRPHPHTPPFSGVASQHERNRNIAVTRHKEELQSKRKSNQTCAIFMNIYDRLASFASINVCIALNALPRTVRKPCFWESQDRPYWGTVAAQAEAMAVFLGLGFLSPYLSTLGLRLLFDPFLSGRLRCIKR